MRRSSRIQTKKETSSVTKSDSISCRRNSKASSENLRLSSRNSRSRLSKTKDIRKRKGLSSKVRASEDQIDLKISANESITFHQETPGEESTLSESDPTGNKEANGGLLTLLTQEETKSPLISKVTASIKIDRTIKNLSPKKFFLNKDGKTTRSGRSFSPYDFATYSLIFGHLNSGNETLKESTIDVVRSTANPIRKVAQGRKIRGKKRNREITESRRLKIPKNCRGRQYRRKRQGFIKPSEISNQPVDVPSPVVTMKVERPDSSEEFYSEEASTAFMFDFPPPPANHLEGHSLPPGFYNETHEKLFSFVLNHNIVFQKMSDVKLTVNDNEAAEKMYFLDNLPTYRTYEPVSSEETRALSPMCSSPSRKWGQYEMEALSKVSLSDADKYEFKSVFKDAQIQVANFESQSGHDVPGGDVNKFDLMESENVEGRRFYRKRITDSRLIAWHKYNLMSSTKYLDNTDPPLHARPIIKVRSNQCPRADFVWRLNQTLPPPSIDEVLELTKSEQKTKYNPSAKIT